MTNTDEDKPTRRRGWARMRELNAADEADRKQLEAELIANLNRTPNAIDVIAIETLVATVIRARRLRAAGKSDADERKTILQAIRATGIRPPPPAAASEQPADPFGIFGDGSDGAAADEEVEP